MAKYLVVFALLFGACSKKATTPAADAGRDYYPLQAGAYSVFEVDSVVYTEIPRDTVHYRYRIKELFADTFRASDGALMWRLERYIQPHQPPASYDSLPWQIKDVWSVLAEPARIVVAEENVPVTRLIFPVRKNARWDGYASTNTGDEFFEYVSVDEKRQVGDFQFARVVTVKQKAFRTLISFEESREWYARGRGLVQKSYNAYYSNNIVAGVPVEDRIGHGVSYTQRLVSYGNE